MIYQNNKLVFKRITQPTVAVYDPDGIIIGICVNELEFLDILVQVKRNNLEGYRVSLYPIDEKGKILIDKSGRCKIHRLGIYTEHSKYLRDLMDF